nr:hypothetical protein L204_01923 [Cryptococcus depauperatus CBS 7855]
MPTTSQLHKSLDILNKELAKRFRITHHLPNLQNLQPSFIHPENRFNPCHFKHLFRMPRSEFNDVVDKFAKDIAFSRTEKRKPAASKYQLALTIHRLAHGHEIKTIAAPFGVPGAIPS